MARAPHGEVRDQRVNVRLTVAEFVAVRERAFRSGQSLSDYLRTAALAKPEQRTHQAGLFGNEPTSFHHIRLLGTNLNRIAQSLNARELPAPPDLAPLLAEVRSLLREALARHGA